ncbi:uncharacterized protein LOC120350493 [Nilaparvata lugens]|uniref:uncharacterized protein LOC120350493 n=1 Tax=Nilaparvata lugens TaxID=108931 RepID=UPI00193D5AF5|nr:uncharacterized protein LOC120350493 [Nilaparvata lugens]
MTAVMQQIVEASKAGHMLMALSLLPADKITAGVGVVKLYAQQQNLEEELQDILESSQRQRCPSSSIIAAWWVAYNTCGRCDARMLSFLRRLVISGNSNLVLPSC